MKLLVIGGTRYVGRELIAPRLPLGDDITVVSRGNVTPAWIDDVKHIQCDRNNLVDYHHLLAPYFDVVVDTQACLACHIQSTLHLLQVT